MKTKGKKKYYNRQMKTTVDEDKLAQARKGKKGDDKKGKRARKMSSVFLLHCTLVLYKLTAIHPKLNYLGKGM